MKIGQQEARELAEAGVLADQIEKILAASGASWGVIGVAIATALANGAHTSAPNPGRARRLINETHVLARQLLVELGNEALSEAVKDRMAELIGQTTGRAWAGSRDRQLELRDKVLDLLRGEQRIDVAAVMQTILANMVCDRAESLEHADRGLAAVTGDMRRVAIERFDSGLHAASPAHGRA